MSNVKRWDKVWREEQYEIVRDVNGPFVMVADYEKLERKIARLEKRLLTKKKYEKLMLIHTGATPRFIGEIDAKDQEALSS